MSRFVDGDGDEDKDENEDGIDGDGDGCAGRQKEHLMAGLVL